VNIYIVNNVTGGYYTEIRSSYHLTAIEAGKAYAEAMLSVGDDPVIVELVRLDTSTLEAVTLKFFEGTAESLEGEEDDNEEADREAAMWAAATAEALAQAKAKTGAGVA